MTWVMSCLPVFLLGSASVTTSCVASSQKQAKKFLFSWGGWLNVGDVKDAKKYYSSKYFHLPWCRKFLRRRIYRDFRYPSPMTRYIGGGKYRGQKEDASQHPWLEFWLEYRSKSLSVCLPMPALPCFCALWCKISLHAEVAWELSGDV